MNDVVVDRAKFRALVDSTWKDWEKVERGSKDFERQLPNRVLEHLKSLESEQGGLPVNRLEHSLQSASLAFRDHMDEEYVVCALLHDVGDSLATFNHADLAAAILKPFVSPQNHWMLAHHDMFQGYYFFEHMGFDRNVREKFRGHPAFERTVMFAARHDQSAFDPHYNTMPLEAFVPLVHRVMARPRPPIHMRVMKQLAAGRDSRTGS